MEKLLIVDDSDEIRQQLKWGLNKDYSVHLGRDVKEALDLFGKHKPKVVTLDLGLPPDPNGASEGLRCLGKILETNVNTKVILITGNEERATALEAIQRGAYDYYQKPIDLFELKVILRRAFHLANLEEENQRLSSSMETRASQLGMLFGQCPEMLEVFSVIKKVASCDVPVLILGESGTGKELVAQAIHEKSLRKEGPFIPINCGAIPENLLESELFGHEKGAFTGAQSRVQGKFEYADKGTLFLDELGELPPALQVKILRFLQNRLIQRVGGREDIEVDTRIIAATNIDISDAIAKGTFREDLYYRIGVINISLPPLRERGEDIILLANLFMRRYSDAFNKRIRGFNNSALETMASYPWPGNVRELENKVKRAVILSETPILEPWDLGLQESSEKSSKEFEGMSLREARNRLERRLISHALEKKEGNIVQAAELLGVSRPTLYDLMKKHGMQEG